MPTKRKLAKLKSKTSRSIEKKYLDDDSALAASLDAYEEEILAFGKRHKTESKQTSGTATKM